MTSEITKKKTQKTLDGEDETHESFGVITVHRVSGSAVLFDVGAPQQHFIALSIRHALRYRSLSNDRVHARNEIAEVYMSETQFARMLSSIGMGAGVPCTINRLQGTSMEAPPTNDQGAKLKDDMKASTEYVSALLKDMDEQLKALTEGKTVSKKAVREVQDRMYHARMEIDQNMPFVLDQATEQLEGAVEEARANIDAYQKHRAMELGLGVVQDAIKELKDTDEEG
jgi:Spy/CpxP family protein refolding chaperone